MIETTSGYTCKFNLLHAVYTSNIKYVVEEDLQNTIYLLHTKVYEKQLIPQFQRCLTDSGRQHTQSTNAHVIVSPVRSVGLLVGKQQEIATLSGWRVLQGLRFI